ncbi:MAG: nuclease A inhibitor family protein [Acidobacteriota bacterium]
MTKNIENISPLEPLDAAGASGPVAAAASGLIYISETDADIIPFTGEKCDSVTAAAVLRMSAHGAGDPIEEVVPAQFFAQLTQIKEWYGTHEKDRANGFAALYSVLTTELRDLHVFRIGRIQIDIYIVGIDSSGRLSGVSTKAVET